MKVQEVKPKDDLCRKIFSIELLIVSQPERRSVHCAFPGLAIRRTTPSRTCPSILQQGQKLRNLIAAKARGFFFVQTDDDARAALVVVRLKHPPRLVQARDGCVLRKGDVKCKLDLARAEE